MLTQAKARVPVIRRQESQEHHQEHKGKFVEGRVIKWVARPQRQAALMVLVVMMGVQE